jgi:hypothetical protein
MTKIRRLAKSERMCNVINGHCGISQILYSDLSPQLVE